MRRFRSVSPDSPARRPLICAGRFLLGMLVGCVASVSPLTGAPPDEAKAAPVVAQNEIGVDFFEKKIRPILVQECYSCHSTAADRQGKRKGGLALDSRAAIRRGGESGPAVIPGRPKESLLIDAIKHETFQMPPTKRLAPGIVADFVRWIEAGAPDPRDGDADSQIAAPKLDIETARREHWAFRPLQHSELPSVQLETWTRTPVDRFILAKLESLGLSPSPPADPALLLRRIHLDLIGLPPAPEEVAAFVSGETNYEQVVERLLASPGYGERWGRHWLDLARYADSSGFHNDLDRPNAWRYRDYVIQSLNRDKPYSQFVAEQLAGDEVEGANEETRIATGFNTHGPSNADNVGKNDRDREQYRLDQLDDVISTTSVVFLGLTLGCARCHDHKVDPLASEDYYRWLAIFNGGEVQGGPITKSPKKGEESSLPTVQAFVETTARVRPTFLLRRGSVDLRGPEVPPGTPLVLTERPVEFPTPPQDAITSGRRRALAEWLTAADNALAYRVIANRVWQHHFGRGLVATPNNFGRGGASPTHPELLDYLATQLIQANGSLKSLHRLIVHSATYMQAGATGRALSQVEPPAGFLPSTESVPHSSPARVDPDNRFLWHMPTRRLDAETMRDAMLATSGALNRRQGGPGIKPRIRPELLDASQRNKWPTLAKDGPEQWRRSVYIYVKRQLLMPMMELFDSPTTTTSVGERGQSVLPTQALLLMNDEFVEQQAEMLADRALRESHEHGRDAIDVLMELAWTRLPSDARRQQAREFLRAQTEWHRGEGAPSQEADQRALVDLAHVLLTSNEFLHVE